MQVPRLYNIYKSIGAVDSFADVMKNLFDPLFEVKVSEESSSEGGVVQMRGRGRGKWCG